MSNGTQQVYVPSSIPGKPGRWYSSQAAADKGPQPTPHRDRAIAKHQRGASRRLIATLQSLR